MPDINKLKEEKKNVLLMISEVSVLFWQGGEHG
jgi:hypothetical protein